MLDAEDILRSIDFTLCGIRGIYGLSVANTNFIERTITVLLVKGSKVRRWQGSRNAKFVLHFPDD